MSLDERLRRGLHATAHHPAVAPDPDGDVAAGRALVGRRRRRTRVLAGTAAALVVLATAFVATRPTGDDPADDPTMVGDADEGGGGVQRPAPAPPPTAAPGDEGPPPVRVSAGDRSIELDAYTFCYRSMCADGMPPEPLADIGSADELQVDFGLPDWTFTAYFSSLDVPCSPEQERALEPLGDGRHRLQPAGLAGRYAVTLAGRGEGDAFYSFRWTTTADGPVRAPAARLAVLADHDGRLDSYGVELMVTHLRDTPDQASATVTVRAADGREITFPAPGEPSTRCDGAGELYWTGGAAGDLASIGLDRPVAERGPFTYEVELTLDGVVHTATATWPDDVIVGNEPSVALDFEPALPAHPAAPAS
jgi:hypothetical protein